MNIVELTSSAAEPASVSAEAEGQYSLGGGLLRFYRTRISKNSKIAFLSTLLLGLVIHLYKFTNMLPNHDALYNLYSAQNVVGSGRWFLSIACGIGSFFDLPWINGLLAILYIALTAVIITALLQLQNPVLIVLTGGLLAACPSVTETFFYDYTADGYMLALLLSALAVYLSRLGENRWWCLAAGALCICLACGIYQAYVSFALVLALGYFFLELLENRRPAADYWRWIRNQIIIFVAALIVYYVIWKLCLLIGSSAVNSYRGIDHVGQISFSVIAAGLFKSFKTVLLFFLEWSFFEHGLTLYVVLNLLFLLLMTAIIIKAIIKSGLWHRKTQFVLALLCLAACAPCACLWYFTSDQVSYRPMMLTSLCLLYIFTAVLFERWGSLKGGTLIGLLLAVVIFNWALMANISYFFLQQSYEQTYAVGAEMMWQIHAAETEYEVDKLAVIGNIYTNVRLGSSTPSDKMPMLAAGLEENMLFNYPRIHAFLKNTFGLDLKPATSEQITQLEQSTTVARMAIWPSADAVQAVGDTLVIKISEP